MSGYSTGHFVSWLFSAAPSCQVRSWFLDQQGDAKRVFQCAENVFPVRPAMHFSPDCKQQSFVRLPHDVLLHQQQPYSRSSKRHEASLKQQCRLNGSRQFQLKLALHYGSRGASGVLSCRPAGCTKAGLGVGLLIPRFALELRTGNST